MTHEPDAHRRRLLAGALPGGLLLGGAMLAAPGLPAASGQAPRAHGHLDVTDFGAVGDGASLCADAFQRAFDAAEAAGGGVVYVPPGLWLLERTPLLGSGVHLRGSGAGTVLRGLRPAGDEGAALISNKGQQAPGFSGAHDFSFTHFAIDSPQTNGIVVTHAERVYIAHIVGIDVFNHFCDIVGRQVLCEHLWLTGRSGTSSFQIDSLSGAQTIWDGERAVPPLYDGTDARDVILRSSVITAVAGHQGDRPRHDVSIHFHGDETAGFLFSDLVIGGATTGFYQDANTRYDNIQISNVRSHNPGAALLLNPGRTDQRGLIVRGLVHEPLGMTGNPWRSVAVHGRSTVNLADLQLQIPDGAPFGCGLELSACRQVIARGLQVSGSGGHGVLVTDGAGEARAVAESVLIEGSQFRGVSTGCEYTGARSTAVHSRGNQFTGVGRAHRGPIRVARDG